MMKLILYLRPLNQSYESAVRGYPQTETVLGGSLARTPIEAVSEYHDSVLCKKFSLCKSSRGARSRIRGNAHQKI